MIRKVTCKNCKEAFEIKSSANSRHELEDEKGRYFYAKCNHCHIEKEYHVNEVKSEIGRSNLVIYLTLGIVLFLVSTIYFFRLGLIWSVTLIVPAYVYIQLKSNSQKSVDLFNLSEISRTRTS
ncbi:hypothetical protein [Portibacter lacus]|uniref:Uncharacterized protein n=1 Tax=Portibacter lacus TaxID=1099794 RepID=A0AA37WIB9_9BACT|nr:hypothetical protein [Portibacter lacus]GLR19650.1 hypothetical protein GCM10007940_42660 [Portibacter lacus]